ncbi:hypothetical protein [Nonomuraea sp. NPDC003754]
MINTGYLVTLPSQPKCLGSLTTAHIQDARWWRGQVGGELAGYEFLPNGVRQHVKAFSPLVFG